MKRTFHTNSAAETWQVAATLAREFKPGAVIALHGDLGSGKTTFVQGLGAALGVKGPITSPTFTLCGEYPTSSGYLVHFDLYRLADGSELDSLGFDEYRAGGAIIALEWPERAAAELPAETIHIHFTPGPGAEERIISLI